MTPGIATLATLHVALDFKLLDGRVYGRAKCPIKSTSSIRPAYDRNKAAEVRAANGRS